MEKNKEKPYDFTNYYGGIGVDSMNTRKATLTVLSIALKIVIIAVIALGLVEVGIQSYYYGHAIFQNQAIDSEPGVAMGITIKEDTSDTELAKALESGGVIADWKVFYIQMKLEKFDEKLLPGSYTLTTAMTPEDIMNVLSGEVEEE